MQVILTEEEYEDLKKKVSESEVEKLKAEIKDLHKKLKVFYTNDIRVSNSVDFGGKIVMIRIPWDELPTELAEDIEVRMSMGMIR